MSNLSLAFDTADLAQHYEECSAEHQFRRGRALVRELSVGPGHRVLDIGAGTGLLAEYVAQIVGPSGSVLGIDPLPRRIEIANRKTAPNLHFEMAGAESLDRYPAGDFDVVYLNAVFHWIPEKRTALERIHRLLKDGGRLGISTGSKEHCGTLQELKRELLEREPYRRYVKPTDGAPETVTIGELAELLLDTAFQVVKLELADNVQYHRDAAAAIAFSEASSFGNFFGHLPEPLREQAAEELHRSLERHRTPEGIRLMSKRIVAIARKPSLH